MIKDRAVPYHISSIFTSKLLMAIVFLFLVISLVSHQQEMRILLLFVLFLHLFSYIWSRFAFLNLDIDFTINKTHVFPGDDITIRIVVHNRKLLPVWVTSVPFFDETGFENRGLSKHTVCLFWFQKTSFTHKIKAKKRGVFQIDYPNITASDLFSFFPRQRQISQPVEIIIFPSIAAINPFLIPEQYFFGLPGTKSPVLDPVYILGVREYQYGTPAKMIHWKASARLDRLREKVCEPSVQGKTMIMVDVQGFEPVEGTLDFERLLETAAGLAAFLAKKGHRVGFLTNAVIKGSDHYMVPYDTGRANVSKVFELIARIEMKKRVPINSLSPQYSISLKGASVVLLCREADNLSLVDLKMPRSLKMKRLNIIQSLPVKEVERTIMSLPGNISNMSTVRL